MIFEQNEVSIDGEDQNLLVWEAFVLVDGPSTPPVADIDLGPCFDVEDSEVPEPHSRDYEALCMWVCLEDAVVDSEGELAVLLEEFSVLFFDFE